MPLRASRSNLASAPFQRVMIFFPNALAGVQVSYTCASLADGLARHVQTRIYAHALIKGYRHPLAVPACRPLFTRWGYRYLRRWLRMQPRLEARFENDLRPGDLVWLWPGRIVPTAKRIRARGGRMVVEAINCHQATARRILDDAYRRLGWTPQHGLTDERIRDETTAYALADAVFSPHPCVTASLLENGVPASNIVSTSYGWDPRLMPEAPDRRDRGDAGTVLFVGTVCVRKGAHLLVQAWRDADLSGTLRLVGWVAEEFRGHEREYLSGRGVELVGPVHPRLVGKAMAEADIFAFPTLEESGPQVTYEAASQGLAILTTPMGAGAIVRDGIEGMILDPYDRDGWVNALRTLHKNPDLRRRLGEAARRRAAEFTWKRVAGRRYAQLCEFFDTTKPPLAEEETSSVSRTATG